MVAIQEAKVAEAELEAAKVTVQRHKVLAPISGEVSEIVAHKGEAVQPTQPAIRIIKLDNLWVEGRVSASRLARAELDGQDVTVDVAIKSGEKRSLPGKVVFVRPLTDTGGTYMVRAMVKNIKLNDAESSWLLYPGMQAEMNIQLRRLP